MTAQNGKKNPTYHPRGRPQLSILVGAAHNGEGVVSYVDVAIENSVVKNRPRHEAGNLPRPSVTSPTIAHVSINGGGSLLPTRKRRGGLGGAGGVHRRHL